MSTKQLLIAAREIIEKPENWTKETFARTRSGKETFTADAKACMFCAEGALIRAQQTIGGNVESAVLTLENLVGSALYLSRFNDSHTHQEVLNVFDQAIANCSP